MRALTVGLVGTAIVALCGCSGAPSDPGLVKAGATAGVRHVMMADSQGHDAPSSIAMGLFAAHVRELSQGRLVVDTTSGGEYGDNDGDAKVVKALTDGRLQLATVPTRAWSDLGVRSTDVLQAPFEIRSNAHMVAVAKDSTLVRAALSDLDATGVHGLAVLPERLRVLVGFGAPIRTPADLAGQPVRSLSSSVGAVLTTLGAKWVNPNDSEFAAMRSGGTVRAMETDYVRAVGVAGGATLSSDLVLYAKFVSIAANGEWWSGLPSADRKVIESAAAMTVEDTAATLTDPADEAVVFCNAGGSIIEVGQASVDAFHAAVAARTEAVDSAALRSLRADAPKSSEAAPAPCAPAPGDLDPRALVPDGGALPDGVYRMQWTDAFARQWNAKGKGILFEGPDAPGNFRAMTFTWTFRAGHYAVILDRDGKQDNRGEGRYQAKGDQVLLELPQDFGGVVNRLQWRVNPDRSLTLTQVDGLKADPYYAVRWARIGDA